MSSLKLGPMPTTRTTKLSITIPAPLHDALELYRQAYASAYEPVELARLIPHVLQTFLLSDRAFMDQHGSAVRVLLSPPLLQKAERRLGE
jgi:hypothetical protein